MRRALRWFIYSVVAVDAVVAAVLLLGGLSTPGGAADTTATKPAPAQAPATEPKPATAESHPLLAEELAKRAAELERKQAELDEAIRGAEVLRRAGLAPELPPEETTAQETRAPKPAKASKKNAKGAKPEVDPFTKLGRAYENMEPDSAAKAVAELALRDQQAVVQMLMGWKPRTAGAVLDALTRIQPSLAADLSYEIWRQGGNAAPEAADIDR